MISVEKSSNLLKLMMTSGHPMSEFLELQEIETTSDLTVQCRVAAPAAFVRDAQSGLVHTGFATLVLDTLMGASIYEVLQTASPIATVGLSINHLRRPQRGEMIRASAWCIGVHGDIAYVEGKMVSIDRGDTLAVTGATFMVGTRTKSIRDRGTDESRI